MGGEEAGGKLKAAIRIQAALLYLHYVTQTEGWAKTAIRSSLVAHAVLRINAPQG